MISEPQGPAFGVNVFGYFYAESGIGEHSRQLVETIKRSRVPYVAIPYTRTLTRQQHRFEDPTFGPPRYPINIVSVNADELPHFAADVGEEFLRSRYTIGLWAWEIEEFPDSMAASQQYLDEVWANSGFSAKAIEKSIQRPVHPFPLPVSVPDIEVPPRPELGLPEDFVFLFCFDFDSIYERKNPTAVVRAFLEAFPDQDGVSLYVKSINGSKAPQRLAELRAAAGVDRRITVVDGYWESPKVRALMASCDAYLSLHRAEGFGLTMAEAMAYGRPVIATRYSGNLDFMNDRNSFLVDVRMTEIGAGCEPYPKGALWAEPDVEHAAQLLRKVVAAPAAALSKAELGKMDIEQHHSPAARSRFVRRRIEEIAASLPTRPAGTELPGIASGFPSRLAKESGSDETPPTAGFVGVPTEQESDSIAHLAARLEEGPDLRRPTRLGLPGLWLRRTIFRLLRNYHLYQLQVGRSTLLVLRELDRSLQETRDQLAEVDRRLERIEHRLDSDSAKNHD